MQEKIIVKLLLEHLTFKWKFQHLIPFATNSGFYQFLTFKFDVKVEQIYSLINFYDANLLL